MSDTFHSVPLTATPQSVDIALGGKDYRLTARWSDAPDGGWLLDIQTAADAVPLIMGIPLVAGADLLEQYAYLGLGGELWVDADLPPTATNLGSDAPLVFVARDDQ